SSTRTCLKTLLPLLQPSGSVFSQDANLPRVAALLGNESFWREECSAGMHRGSTGRGSRSWCGSEPVRAANRRREPTTNARGAVLEADCLDFYRSSLRHVRSGTATATISSVTAP